MAVAACVVLAALAVCGLGGAATSAGTRTTGVKSLGVLGDPVRFDALTRQHSRTRLLIVGWGQGGTAAYFASLFATMSDIPMLGLGTGTAITPGQIARGAGDDYLAALNAAVAAWGKPIFIRPLAEMNGYWNAYCAFNQNGSPRGSDYSTEEYRKAFARIYLLVHGGPSVNQRLRQLGLPPFQGTLAANGNAKVVWNPQGYGDPDLPANSAQSYYPGDAYVDVVGDDIYDIRGKAEWASADDLYAAHPGKPFSFPEWGLWGLDDPTFIDAMGAFVHGHPRVELVSYYSAAPGSTFDLATKPRSLAEYRRVISPLGG